MARLPRTFSAAALTVGSLLASSFAIAQAPAGSANAPAAAPSGPASAAQPTSPAPTAPTAAPTTSAPPAAPSAPPATTTVPVSRGALLPPKSPPPATTVAPTTAPSATPVTTPSERPQAGGQIGANPNEVYAEDWWSHARPVLELHGYFRMRAELFHNFSLGRVDPPDTALWPVPPDNSYRDEQGNPHTANLCGDNPAAPQPCLDKTQAGANIRFRVNPELHISDNLRILSQIDMLDNVVLGSTPEGYYSHPTGTGSGYTRVAQGGYVPTGAFSTTQVPPTAGVNSYKNSIEVKRVWGEYMTPVGQLRFGRMPSHWGLGILANSGDTYDSDWQSTSDRIMFITGIKSIDLYFAGAWDFVNEGPSSATVDSLAGGQPYDLAQLDDVNQYVLVLVRRRNPELAKLDLARGDVVLNGGMYFVFRNQFLSTNENNAIGATPGGYGTDWSYVRTGAKAYIPDAWIQLLYRKFRFEAEAVTIQGSLDTIQKTSIEPAKIRQYGLATQTELKAVEDRLRLQFGFGWASGDANLSTAATAKQTMVPPAGGLQTHVTGPGSTYSEFRFHPDYRVDLILFRNILQRVQGAYYFRPSVDYDFARNPNGQRFGGGAAVIWSRASEFVQTPGHKRDLGLEIDLSLYFQSKDGSLNDDPDKMGGFFTMLQYGVMFPLGGLGYMSNEAAVAGMPLDTSTAQTIRWYAGILF